MDLPLTIPLHHGSLVGEEVVVVGRDGHSFTVAAREVGRATQGLRGVFGPPRRNWGPEGSLHLKGELRMGKRIRLWCVCGWSWEGENRDAEAAWKGHIGEDNGFSDR